MMTKANTVSVQSPPRTYDVPHESRGQLDYPVDAWDLLAFGRSPFRWVHTPPPEDNDRPTFLEVLRLLHLVPEHLDKLYVLRPKSYQAVRHTCPKCQSVGPGRVCKACNMARKNVFEERPWSNTAKFCADWTEQHTRHLQRIVPHDLFERARAALDSLDNDAEVQALHQSANRHVALRGLWHDEPTGLDIPLRGVVSYAPAEGETRDDSLASLHVTRDVSPTQWAGYAHARGHHAVAAFLQDLHGAATGDPRPHHLWVLVEQDEPFVVGRRRASPELLNAGRSLYQDLLGAYARCLATQSWPAFDPNLPGSIDSWSAFHLEPWMTQGDGHSGRFFGVEAAHTLPLAA